MNVKQKYYPFPCDCCGECCKFINKSPFLLGFDRGDGVCKYLNAKNQCDIYPIRPNVCNGKYVYENYFSHISVEEFHRYTYSLCEKIKGRNKI